jgi:hypothetical protein
MCRLSAWRKEASVSKRDVSLTQPLVLPTIPHPPLNPTVRCGSDPDQIWPGWEHVVLGWQVNIYFRRLLDGAHCWLIVCCRVHCRLPTGYCHWMLPLDVARWYFRADLNIGSKKRFRCGVCGAKQVGVTTESCVGMFGTCLGE